MGALGAKASESSMKGEKTGVFIQHSLMRSGLRDAGGEAVQGLLHARAENALRQRNTDPDIRVDVQGNDSVEGYGGGGPSTESPAHLFLFLHGQNIPETPRVQLIHIHRGLMYCHRGDNESLPMEKQKDL